MRIARKILPYCSWSLVVALLVVASWIFSKSFTADDARKTPPTQTSLVGAGANSTKRSSKPREITSQPAEKKPSETWERIFGNSPDLVNRSPEKYSRDEFIEIERLLIAEFKRLVTEKNRKDLLRLCELFHHGERKILFRYEEVHFEPPIDGSLVSELPLNERKQTEEQFFQAITLVMDIFDLLDIYRVVEEDITKGLLAPRGNYIVAHYTEAFCRFIMDPSGYPGCKPMVPLSQEQTQLLDSRLEAMKEKYNRARLKIQDHYAPPP